MPSLWPKRVVRLLSSVVAAGAMAAAPAPALAAPATLNGATFVGTISAWTECGFPPLGFGTTGFSGSGVVGGTGPYAGDTFDWSGTVTFGLIGGIFPGATDYF